MPADPHTLAELAFVGTALGGTLAWECRLAALRRRRPGVAAAAPCVPARAACVGG